MSVSVRRTHLSALVCVYAEQAYMALFSVQCCAYSAYCADETTLMLVLCIKLVFCH